MFTKSSRSVAATLAALPAALALTVGAAAPAGAYEFEVRALTQGQGYQLRSFRLLDSDLVLDRRRFTQTLVLDMWDLAGRRSGRAAHDSRPERGPNVYFTSMLRIDHDFGDYTTGDIQPDRTTTTLVPAADLIPELGQDDLALDLLYAYVGVEDVFGMLDLRLGRQLGVDTLDWWSFDGLTVRATTPLRVAVEAFGGLRVRDDSFLGPSTQEPDGVGWAQCAEYVEDTAHTTSDGHPVPGGGHWIPFVIDDHPYDFCPQRRELMPTFGGAIETANLGPVYARVAYRRSESRTPGGLSPSDLGLYPNESGLAPTWGVNEERLSASVRAVFSLADGRIGISPYAAARYSLLHGLVDEAMAGVRLRRGAHSLSPEVGYSFPTFDGDSIFNVFSAQAYTDARIGYELAPRGCCFSGYVRGWVRRFAVDDFGTDVKDGTSRAVDGVGAELAAGAQLGVRWRPAPERWVRGDLFHEDGYGGRRTGGMGSTTWAISDDLAASGRLSVISFDEDVITTLDGLAVGAQLGATYVFSPGVAVHALVEENTSPVYQSALRVVGVLDLAFNPEL